MKPSTTALADQAAAATVHAAAILATLAATDSRYRTGTPGPVMTAVVQRIADRARRGQLSLCPHLSWTSPQPAYWCPWKPGRLRCAICTEQVQERIRGTREDRRCDHCGAVPDRIHADRLQLPAIVADAGEPRCMPPVIAIFGLCPDCQHADTTDREEPIMLPSSSARRSSPPDTGELPEASAPRRGTIAPTATATWRRARAHSICRAPGCIETIRPGNALARLPGVGWVHAGCANAAAATDRSDQ